MAKETSKPEEKDIPVTEAITIADENGEMMELPDIWQIDEDPGIKMMNQARDYRAFTEKAKGWFEANGEKKGPTIKAIILNARQEHGVKFGPQYPEAETVSQFIFIDEENIVSTGVFRTSAHENFQQLLDNMKIGKKLLPQQEVTMTMEKKTTKDGFGYHLVNFSYEQLKPERFKEVVEFVRANPRALACFRSLPKEA